MSQIERCQSKWCNVNGFKGLNWSQDKADSINIGGNALSFVKRRTDSSQFIFDMPFFIIRCVCMKFVQMGLLATVLAFGLVVVIGFTNAN